MKAKYFTDTDTLFLELSDRSPIETREISENVMADYDDSGRIVGITIEHAKHEAAAPEFSYEQIDIQGAAKKPTTAARRKLA